MAVDDQYTVSLLHFDGGITDESGKVWAAAGGAITSTTQSKFGGSSLYLNGTNQYLTTPNSVDFDFGAGDFTIDWWEYRNNGANGCVFVRDSGDSYPAYAMGGVSGTNIVFSMTSTGTSWDIAASVTMGAAIYNAWTHYAIVRKDNNIYAFQNGVLTSTTTSNASIFAGRTAPTLGYQNVPSYVYYFGGYLDEFRISKGIARWTSDFTPPTAPYSPATVVNAPTNLSATAGDAQVTLSWEAVTGATGYNIKRATVARRPYTTIASNITDVSYVDSAVQNGTTYYYVVTAVNVYSESANSNEASATPNGNGLLRVTMIDSSEREYALSDTDIEGFISWFNSHASTDATSYMLNKSVGSQVSKEYLVFGKIISFAVVELN